MNTCTTKVRCRECGKPQTIEFYLKLRKNEEEKTYLHIVGAPARVCFTCNKYGELLPIKDYEKIMDINRYHLQSKSTIQKRIKAIFDDIESIDGESPIIFIKNNHGRYKETRFNECPKCKHISPETKEKEMFKICQSCNHEYKDPNYNKYF